MKSIRFSQQLNYADCPTPSVPAHNVLVKIHASSLNPHDWKMVNNLQPLTKLLGKSLPLGHDFSGEIVQVGKNVKKFSVGDEVFGMSMKMGTFGQYISLNNHMIAKKPTELTHQQSAVIPMAGLTSLQMYKLLRLKAGQSVLINGASGGVGTFAIQIAKAQGAHVVGVCSQRNTSLVQELGVDEVIDYNISPVTEMKADYDIVIDAVGNIPLSYAKHLVKKDGRYLTTVPTPRLFLMMLTSRLPFVSTPKMYTLLALPFGWHVKYLADLVRNKKLQPVVDRVYAIEALEEAIEYSQTGRARGKIALHVAHFDS